MSIMDKLFGVKQSAPQVPATPATGNPAGMNIQPGGAAENNIVTAPNGVVPSGSSNEPVKQQSPMDEFKDVWQPNLDKDGKPIVPVDPATKQLFNVDPEKLRQSAASVDFGKVIKPETIQAVVAGGEGAATAFLQALNGVAQEVYASSAIATTKIVEQAVKTAREDFLKEIPTHIRSQSTTEAVRAKNPVFNSPAASVMVEGVKNQFEQKYPTATASEIADMTTRYFDSFATEFTAPSRKAQEQAEPKEFDWDQWASH